MLTTLSDISCLLYQVGNAINKTGEEDEIKMTKIYEHDRFEERRTRATRRRRQRQCFGKWHNSFMQIGARSDDGLAGRSIGRSVARSVNNGRVRIAIHN